MRKSNAARTIKIVSLAAFSALLLSTSGLAATAKDSPKREGFNEPLMLANLKQLKLVVGKLDAYATENGESEDNIKHLLLDGLATTHITVADDSAGASKDCGPSDIPLLYLKVKVIPDGGSSKGAACSVHLALVEKAKVARNKKDLMVSVWTSENVGRLGDGGASTKAAIDEQVQRTYKDFHRDYLLANSADSSKDLPEENHGKTNKKIKSPR